MNATPATELSVFVRVARAGSLAAAARELGVPKSTVSRALTRLETRLGVSLLHRSPRALVLTDAGAGLLDRAGPHIDAIADALVGAAEAGDVPRGLLRVTVSVDVAEYLIAPRLPHFLARHPYVDVDLILTQELLDLREGGIDMAIRASRDSLRDSALTARKVAESRVGLYASASYAARRQLPRTPEELADHDCVLFRGREGQSTWHFPESAPATDVDVRGRINCDDFYVVRAAVLAGAGIGPLPNLVASAPLAAGALVPVLAEHPIHRGAIWLVHRGGRVPPKLAVFRDFLIESLRGAIM